MQESLLDQAGTAHLGQIAPYRLIHHSRSIRISFKSYRSVPTSVNRPGETTVALIGPISHIQVASDLLFNELQKSGLRSEQRRKHVP
jgi:hypothetical protein